MSLSSSRLFKTPPENTANLVIHFLNNKFFIFFFYNAGRRSITGYAAFFLGYNAFNNGIHF